MFRKVGRWKNEKIKVVFRLQFQATQVPCTKTRLMISLVPDDVGQPTVRLAKADVQDGICTWENPVFESVKFTRENKTGKLHDKVYHFIISTGSSKGGFRGEVSVNLADYVQAFTPSAISLPLKFSNSAAILHVTIQNMQRADDQREVQGDMEENGLPTPKNLESILQSQLSTSTSDGDAYQNTHEDERYNTHTSPVGERRSDFRNANTLNSILEQKDSRYYQENSSDQSPSTKSSDSKAPNKHRLTLNWSSDDDDEDINDYLENTVESPLKKPEQGPPLNPVEQLTKEVFDLKRQAEVTDIELLSLRRQVLKETKRGQELSTQVAKYKEERDALRVESEKLKSLLKSGANDGFVEPLKNMESERKKSSDTPSESKQEIKHMKDLNRALRSQLRRTQDTNSELVLTVRGFEDKLDKKNKEIANLSSKIKERDRKSQDFSNEETQQEVNLLKQQIADLQGELDKQVKEKEKLEKEIEQITLDYEDSKKENTDLSSKFNQKQLDLLKKEKECANSSRKVEDLQSQVARLEKVLKKQAEEFFESSDIVSELETQINILKDELEEMTNAKLEQEQRTLQAEENLRKTKVENATAANRLQEEFRKLSEELTAKFNENEELTVKAEADVQDLHNHINILEENLQKADEELQLVQEECQSEVQKLTSLLTEKEQKLQQITSAHKTESSELKSIQTKSEEKLAAFLNENQALRMEVERLTEENYYFTQQLEEMKTLMDETKAALEKTRRERDDLETNYVSASTELDKYLEETKTLRSLKESADLSMGGVQSELDKLQVQCNELKNKLSELKLENDNLKKQATRQKETLLKKENELSHLEKLKNTSSKEVSTLKEKIKQLKAIRPAGIAPDNGSKVEERKAMGRKSQLDSKRETNQDKKVPDTQISDLLKEVELLKEKNKSREDELQEMQDKYSEVSLKFAEVEGERQQLVMTIRNLRNGQKR